MIEKKKKIIIIGAGPGGLSAGSLLAHAGHRVIILEKNNFVGGRNSRLSLGDYHFDLGPTFFMMDFVLRDIFKSIDRNLDDYVRLIKLSPMYRLNFIDNQINIFSDNDLMNQEFAKIFPEENGLPSFKQKESWRLSKLYPLLSSSNNHFRDVFSWRFISALPAFALGRNLFQELGRYFKSDKARLCFTFQSKYLGMSPWECPGAFAMVPYVEHQYGIYHLEGGLSQASTALGKVFTEEGGELKLNSEVAEILVREGQAYGVKLKSGEEILADKIIMNTDFAYGASKLFTPKLLKKYSPVKLGKKKYSCSTMMLYLGLKTTYDLPHHSIVFADKYKQNVEDIFAGRLSESDFSLYVCNPSALDKTLAPVGHSALYVLIPVPNNQFGLDWKEESGKIRERALDIIERRLGLIDIRQQIEVEKIITPTDWQNDHYVYQGAVFNLGHQLRQMLWFRPHNKFEEIENVYLVGGGTHPGSGLPTIYKSGQIVANLINQDS